MQSEKPFSFLAWLVCLVAGVLAMFYMPWVLCQLWAWFVIPTFGLPALTIPLAMGLTLIGMLLTRSYDVQRTKTP